MFANEKNKRKTKKNVKKVYVNIKHSVHRGINLPPSHKHHAPSFLPSPAPLN